MAEPRDVRKHVEHLIERAQDDILDASRELADGITRSTDRFVPPVSTDIERMLDVTFDFAERVIKGQRKMVNDVVKTINEQRDRAADVGRTTTQRAVKRVTNSEEGVHDEDLGEEGPGQEEDRGEEGPGP